MVVDIPTAEIAKLHTLSGDSSALFVLALLHTWVLHQAEI